VDLAAGGVDGGREPGVGVEGAVLEAAGAVIGLERLAVAVQAM
jgi:hypothetical protein